MSWFEHQRIESILKINKHSWTQEKIRTIVEEGERESERMKSKLGYLPKFFERRNSR